MKQRVALAGMATLLLVAWSCTAPARPRYGKEQAQESLGRLETPGLVIGEFALAADPVVDGDTIRVEGLDQTLRLLALDTEETFKTAKERRAYAAGWDSYYATMQGSDPKPVKMATPMGDEAKRWTKEFFAGVTKVRLEREDAREIRDYYGRYLAYVLVDRPGGSTQNFAVEAVRAGMSPYFMKYGYSRRYHDQLVAAQREAQAARRGIWDPAKEHYRDYDVRLAWWTGRAEFIAKFHERAAGRDDHVLLTQWDSLERIEAREGKEVVLLGSVSRVRRGDRGPSIVFLSRGQRRDFPVVFFDKDVFGSSGIERLEGEYVVVRGVVQHYQPKRGAEQLQVLVSLPGHVELGPLPSFAEGQDAPAPR